VKQWIIQELKMERWEFEEWEEGRSYGY